MPAESNKLPKYFNISREIISMIQRGDMQPGALVPSENEIIAKYEVSNTTARKALHDLERAGWVTRVKGKGTFVRNNTVERSVNRIFGFTKNMVEAGRKPSTKLIGFHLRDDDHARTINRRECILNGPYCEIERIRYADGIPMMKETRYISLQFCPEIHRKNLEQSLFAIYEKDYGIRMIEFDQMLSTVLLEGEWLKSFKLDKPVPSFRVEGVTFCGKGLILEIEDAYYRGDMYRFSAKATA
ncbi:MAG: GntR family transcriptional regulator [Verrucomicrobiota bacterium]